MPPLLVRRRLANVAHCDAGSVADFGRISLYPGIHVGGTHQRQGPVVGTSLLKAVAIECKTTQP